MTREEANARLAELQTTIHASITEAEELATEHHLEFTIRGGPQLQQQIEGPIRFVSEVHMYNGEEDYVQNEYIGQWISSYC